MCKYYIKKNGFCSLKNVQPDGTKYSGVTTEINQKFQEIAQKSPHYKDAPLGVACSPRHCCFDGGKYATWTDCPYFERQ